MALFGRKINNAEHQLAFIEMLRLITDGRISPEEAVRAYHGVLQGKGIKPHRPLEEDLKLTDQAMSYDGGAARRATSASSARIADRQSQITKSVASATRDGAADPQTAGWPKRGDGSPDFATMTPAQRLAYDAERLRRKFG